MSPLRNAQQIPWETAFTFEQAMNTIDDIADENELFVYPLDEKAEQLLSLVELAKRQIIGAWIGKFPSPADEKALRSRGNVSHDLACARRRTRANRACRRTCRNRHGELTEARLRGTHFRNAGRHLRMAASRPNARRACMSLERRSFSS